MKVLIGGGTGFIGRNLHRALLKRGHTVSLISRNPGKDRITWTELKGEQSLPDCEAVVNLAGEYILNFFRRWNDSYKKDIFDSRIGTNNIIVKLISKGNVKPNVWVSCHAEGIYPRCNSMKYDENFVLDKAETYIQKLCLEWENSAKLPKDENVRHVGIRTGIVLGKDGGLIQQSYWPFWFGVGGTLGSGQQQLPWIHIKDLTNLFIHAIENENVDGFLNGVSPGSCTSAQFTKAFGNAINRPTIFPVPDFVINFAAGTDRAPLMLTSGEIIPTRTVESGYTFEFEDINKTMKDILG